jgi:hypothetical protein
MTVRADDEENRPVPGAHLALVPESGRRHRPDLYRLAVSDDAGQSVIRGIPPGDYKLFAWDSLEPNAHLNSDFLRSHEDLGTPLRIRPGENGAVVIKVIRTRR